MLATSTPFAWNLPLLLKEMINLCFKLIEENQALERELEDLRVELDCAQRSLDVLMNPDAYKCQTPPCKVMGSVFLPPRLKRKTR